LSDIDAISKQSPYAVIALTGDFNSLNTDSFDNDCGLVMLKDSATHGKRFWISFLFPDQIYIFVKQWLDVLNKI
jgi:hypothetical protein